jgi:ribonuclease D
MIFIDSQEKLSLHISTINAVDKIGFDCEFIRENTFIPILCLIQIATEDEIYIIDPIKIDIQPILQILLAPNILKIMHSCDQDVDVFYKNFNIIPYPIFDTQIAASFLGHGEAISYEKLVKKLSNISLNKSNKLTNWQLRPLRREQINYAENDVKFLFIFYFKLYNKLKDSERISWFLEETELLYKVENYYQDPENIWKKIANSNDSPFFLNYLRRFAKLRETIAIKENKPRKFIMKDEVLIALAKLQPQNALDILNDRILKKLIDKKLITELILAANEVAKEKIALEPIYKSKIPNSKEMILDVLKIYLKFTAKKHGIALKNIATSSEMNDFIRGNEVKFLHGWRYDIFGKFALEILNGKSLIKIENGKIDFLLN